MIDLNFSISIITLNERDLNKKIFRVNKNNVTQLCVIYKKLACKGRLKIKVWKKINHVNNNQKKAGVAIFISDKVDFRAKTQEVHYIMLEDSIYQEEIAIQNLYAPTTEMQNVHSKN